MAKQKKSKKSKSKIENFFKKFGVQDHKFAVAVSLLVIAFVLPALGYSIYNSNNSKHVAQEYNELAPFASEAEAEIVEEEAEDDAEEKINRVVEEAVANPEEACGPYKDVSADDIPTNMYKAFYFNSNNPDATVHCELTDAIEIRYGFAEGPNFTLDSHDFGGYWVGNIEFPATIKANVHIDHGRSHVTMKIDGKVVYDENPSSKPLTYTFEAGTRKIELLYENDWHTTDIAVRIAQPKKVVSVNEAAALVQTNASNVSNVYAVNSYGSSLSSRQISVLAKNDNPAIVFLNSYQLVTWDLSQYNPKSLKYAVVSSYIPGTSVINPNNVPVVYIPYQPHFRTMFPSGCEWHGNRYYYCPNVTGSPSEFSEDYNKYISNIQKIAGKKPTGFDGAYEVHKVTVPDKKLNAAEYKKIDQNLQALLGEENSR